MRGHPDARAGMIHRKVTITTDTKAVECSVTHATLPNGNAPATHHRAAPSGPRLTIAGTFLSFDGTTVSCEICIAPGSYCPGNGIYKPVDVGFYSASTAPNGGYFDTFGTYTAGRTHQNVCEPGFRCFLGVRYHCRPQDNQYQDRPGETYCKICSTCPTGYVVNIPCTSTTNTVCRDATPPILQLRGDASYRLEAGATFVEPGYTTSDNAGGSIFVSRSGTINSTVGAISYLTYTATDVAGNWAKKTRTVLIVDTLPPTLTLDAGEHVTITNIEEFVPAATIFDAGDPNVVLKIQGVPVNTSILGIFEVTYTATDASGNAVTKVQQVEVVDRSEPVIRLLGAVRLRLSAGTPFVEPGYWAIDNGVQMPNEDITVTGSVNSMVVGLYVLSYTAVDESGNVGSARREVIVEDRSPPVIVVSSQQPLVLEATQEYSAQTLGIAARDEFSDDPLVQFQVAGRNSMTVSFPYPMESATLVLYAIDSMGNFATKTVTAVIVDTTAPILHVVGDAAESLEGGTPYVDKGVSAIDGVDGDLGWNISTVILGPDGSKFDGLFEDSTYLPGDVFVVHYSVSDRANNLAFAERQITIVDTLAPSLILEDGSRVRELQPAHRKYELTTISAVDLMDGDLTADVACLTFIDDKVVPAAWLNVSGPTTISIVCTVQDAVGNGATETVILHVADTNPPMIRLKGMQNVSLPVGIQFHDPLVEVFDEWDGSIPLSSILEVCIQYQHTCSCQYDARLDS
eukprot:m.171439 g.171439  ORF g.171439 m.171439 type:complete len:742 (-) comp10390_c0_seq1:1098-3323(-)